MKEGERKGERRREGERKRRREGKRGGEIGREGCLSCICLIITRQVYKTLSRIFGAIMNFAVHK